MDDLALATAVTCERRTYARPLAASLFSCEGKLAVAVLELSGDRIVVSAAVPPPAGSMAVLARNGLRLMLEVAAAEGERLTLRADAPIEAWRLDWFAGASGDRPVGREVVAVP